MSNLQKRAGIRAGLTALLVLAALSLAAPDGHAQSSREAAALSLRLNQTEERLRRMTGRVEQLTHRLQQMEDRLRRALEDTEFRFRELGKGKGKRGAVRTTRPAKPRQRVAAPSRRGSSPGAIGGRDDKGDYGGNSGDTGMYGASGDDGGLDPARAGTVRTLGVIPGRSLNFNVNPDRSGMVPQSGAVPMDARESYDQAYGLILRQDYAGAERAFHKFLNSHGNDPLAGNAQYWLGESYYARGLYRDAADAFLAGYTKYKRSPKAPSSLFKLGMTLVKLKQKQAACASFAELGRKFPSAPKALKTRAARERRRAGC